MVRRWALGLVGLAGVFAAGASAPVRDDDAALTEQCLTIARHLTDKYRDTPGVSFALACERPDGSYLDLPAPSAPPAPPAPTPVMTVGHPGCVTGAARPVIDTTLPTARTTTSSGAELTYQFQELGGGDLNMVGQATDLTFLPGDLAPGTSYHWRARVDVAGVDRMPWDETGWSPWCEFAVSADAVDYRELGDVDVDTLNRVGVRPDRSYSVKLSGAQQRLLRSGTDVGRTGGRMTLTGPRWTELLMQLSETAAAEQEAVDSGEDYGSRSRAAAYRALIDAISVALGGPRHLDFG